MKGFTFQKRARISNVPNFDYEFDIALIIIIKHKFAIILCSEFL